MALTKLGKYIAISDLRNSDDKYGSDAVVGISTQKKMISTKADLNGVKLTSYKLLSPGHFAYVPDTSRRGDKMSLCFNNTEETLLVSSISVVFYITDENELNPDYLFMFFNRPEFDRYARFNSWGSARETFDWSEMCDIEFELPPIDIQQKYVDIYNAMSSNQQCYERGLEDLKLTCDAYIENLGNDIYHPISNYTERNKKRNQDVVFEKKDVKGFNNEGEFIKPMRLFSGDISTFKIVATGEFVYNSRINSTIKKLSVALNEENDLIVSPAYESFYVSNEKGLYPYYLYMLLQREMFAKKVLFNSFGSSTLVFGIDNLGEVEIPVPTIDVQKAIADIYRTYKERRAINERLKAQIKDICPILIKGSIEEAKKEA